MTRRWLAVAVVLVAHVARADEPTVTPPEAEYECVFEDGSVVRMTLGVSTITVETRFGEMKVPLREAAKIRMGFRYPAGVEEKVRRAVADLGSRDFRTREAAHKTLLGCGEYAVPIVRAGVSDPTPEVAERCATILKTITATLPEDKVDPARDDVITTAEMTIRGRITSDAFQARSRYFGEMKVRFHDLKEFRPVGKRHIGTFTLDAAKHAAPGWRTFFDTQLDVESGQPMTITATGTIDLQPRSPGKLTSGPGGSGPQVPGPGVSVQEGVIGGGGFQPTGRVVYPPHTSGAVYGRIGETGAVFLIGEKLTLPKAPATGRLFLVIAPSPHGASQGEYEVKVQLGK